jgi:signal transduction histidine kinase
LPIAAHLWNPRNREALASVGRVIGAVLDSHALRAALERRVTYEEDERRRIAMDLHDGLGATLTSAALHAQLIRATGDEAAVGTLERTLREGLDDMRMALWSLDAEDQSWAALLARIRRQGSDAATAAGIVITFSSDVSAVIPPSPAIRLALLRVGQEAIMNAIRHSRASRIACSLVASAGGVRLEVEDDGRGLTVQPAREGRGLNNLRRRTATLGGRVAFESPPSGGTRVVASFPWGASNPESG